MENENSKSYQALGIDYSLLQPSTVARVNGLDYIPYRPTAEIVHDTNYFYALQDDTSTQNIFIAFYPLYRDGKSKKIVWFVKNSFLPKRILDSNNAFSSITNIDEILLQMANLYLKNINNFVFFDAYSFALKLEDKISRNYKGKASLALTYNSLINKNVDVNNLFEAKRASIEEFVNQFIRKNFSANVDRSPKLRKAIAELEAAITSSFYEHEKKD